MTASSTDSTYNYDLSDSEDDSNIFLYAYILIHSLFIYFKIGVIHLVGSEVDAKESNQEDLGKNFCGYL